MNIEDAILTRRSIRKYSSKRVNKEEILSILDTAMRAPSACNRQAHKIIYIEKKETKQRLVDYGGTSFIKDAPVVLLFLYDSQTDNIEYRDDIQSSSAFIENFLLLAQAKSLGTCWVCHLPPRKNLKKIFNIPKYLNPIAAVTVGHPKKSPLSVPRKFNIDDIVSEETFSQNIKGSRSITSSFKILFRKLYYILPVFIKKKINPYVDRFFVRKFHN